MGATQRLPAQSSPGAQSREPAHGEPGPPASAQRPPAQASGRSQASEEAHAAPGRPERDARGAGRVALRPARACPRHVVARGTGFPVGHGLAHGRASDARALCPVDAPPRRVSGARLAPCACRGAGTARGNHRGLPGRAPERPLAASARTLGVVEARRPLGEASGKDDARRGTLGRVARKHLPVGGAGLEALCGPAGARQRQARDAAALVARPHRGEIGGRWLGAAAACARENVEEVVARLQEGQGPRIGTRGRGLRLGWRIARRTREHERGEQRGDASAHESRTLHVPGAT